MIKRLNGKVEVQSLDIVWNKKNNKIFYIFFYFLKLRILVARIQVPVPSLDEDIQPHFKVRNKEKVLLFFFYGRFLGLFAQSSI
jgi:hypothetical protein